MSFASHAEVGLQVHELFGHVERLVKLQSKCPPTNASEASRRDLRLPSTSAVIAVLEPFLPRDGRPDHCSSSSDEGT